MLSKRMAECLQQTTYTHETVYWRDGRTVRALDARGLVKHVKFNQSVNLWQFKLTKRGALVVRGLSYINQAAKEAVLA